MVWQRLEIRFSADAVASSHSPPPASKGFDGSSVSDELMKLLKELTRERDLQSDEERLLRYQDPEGRWYGEIWSEPNSKTKKAELALSQSHQVTQEEGTTYVDLSSLN